MKQNDYGRLGAVLSADLINLPEMSATSIQQLFEAHGIRHPEVAAADVDGFRRWRDQLARVFGSGDPAEQCSAVNDLLAAATIRPWVTTHDGLQPHLHFVPDSADLLSRVKAVTAERPCLCPVLGRGSEARPMPALRVLPGLCGHVQERATAVLHSTLREHRSSDAPSFPAFGPQALEVPSSSRACPPGNPARSSASPRPVPPRPTPWPWCRGDGRRGPRSVS